MPYGKGTYGSKVGRPPKKKKAATKAMGGGYMRSGGNSDMKNKKMQDKVMNLKHGGHVRKSSKKK